MATKMIDERNLSSLTCENKYAALTDQEIKQELHGMGVDIMEPESGKEELMAEAFDAFSSFILEEEQEKCEEILDKYIDIGSSVGELQGGSDQHAIYRVLIDEDEHNAATELLKEFHSSYQGKRYSSVFTIQKLKSYMLGMCDRRPKKCEFEYINTHANSCTRKYVKLENLMFILSFGPIKGQVRHIDNMVPNLQICLYMSSDCPSTIVYAMDGPPVTNVDELINYWQNTEVSQWAHEHSRVPDLVKRILRTRGDIALKSKWYTKYFAFWDTVNINLNCFGKLYQLVSRQLSLNTDPGTTLLAGGNEVHAGPPASNARMFAFAIGILEDSKTNEDESEYENEDNNGEVQYSPVLLHVDLCCILFSIMDYEYSDEKNNVVEAKLFLLTVFLALVKDFPTEQYERLLGDDRSEVRDWLRQIVDKLEDEDSSNMDRLVEKALKSDMMFYSPDVKKRRVKKKKRRNTKNS